MFGFRRLVEASFPVPNTHCRTANILSKCPGFGKRAQGSSSDNIGSLAAPLTSSRALYFATLIPTAIRHPQFHPNLLHKPFFRAEKGPWHLGDRFIPHPTDKRKGRWAPMIPSPLFVSQHPTPNTSAQPLPPSHLGENCGVLTTPIRLPHCLTALSWCRGTESNRRHEDFQSSALPTELPRPWPRNAEDVRPWVLRLLKNASPWIPGL